MKNKQYTKTKNKIYGKPKRGITAGELRAAQLAMETAMNAVQMAIMLSRPIPNYVPGGFVGKSGIVGEQGNEMVITNTLQFEYPDTHGDIIIPGAFDKSILERKCELKGNDLLHSIKILRSHDKTSKI